MNRIPIRTPRSEIFKLKTDNNKQLTDTTQHTMASEGSKRVTELLDDLQRLIKSGVVDNSLFQKREPLIIADQSLIAD